jgi:carbon-monoxide dehydrogenase medium subunit
LFSVGETPILTQEPNRALLGQVPNPESIETVAAFIAQNECDPGTDIHGTAEYRRNLVHVLVRRSLTEALERARN